MKRPFIIKITCEYFGDEVFTSAISDIDMDTVLNDNEFKESIESTINYLQLRFIEQLILRIKNDKEFKEKLNI